MESIFFVISYTTGFFNETWKKISVIFSKPYHFLLNIFGVRTKSKDVEDVQELTDEEYNRRFGKFFPKLDDEKYSLEPNSQFEKTVFENKGCFGGLTDKRILSDNHFG
ncbi:hypothetical protein JCM14076_32460 [Methylosoma difficile]